MVFRHLPLPEIHPHAQLAAEASEAAAAQGRFRPMLETLYRSDGGLSRQDITVRAAGPGLDVERFTSDLFERRHTLRVERDIDSAYASGQPGPPRPPRSSLPRPSRRPGHGR